MGNLALIISTRVQTDLFLARVSKDLVRSRGRRSARDQMPIMRSRMLAYPTSQLLFALVTQREEGEHVA